MKNYKLAGIIGLIIVAVQTYLETTMLMGKFSGPDLNSELWILLWKTLIFIAPAIVLLSRKGFQTKVKWPVWLYPTVLLVSFGWLYISPGPVAAGLPFLLVVFPFCILFAIYCLIKK